jgi:hypothetical protein
MKAIVLITTETIHKSINFACFFFADKCCCGNSKRIGFVPPKSAFVSTDGVQFMGEIVTGRFPLLICDSSRLINQPRAAGFAFAAFYDNNASVPRMRS